MKFHCLFEQSGTFKNVFKSYGHEAIDYDILDDYGQTDFKIDLFAEIEAEYKNVTNTREKSILRHDTIFTKMKPETDFIMAFFPCTSFTDLNEINFTLRNSGKLKATIQNGGKQPIENINWLFKQIETREYMFKLWIKFCFVCEHLGIPTIIENPAGGIGRSYLTLYSPYRPSYCDIDRALFGDKYHKPTNFFAINFEMKENFCGMYFDKEYNTKTLVTKYKKGKVTDSKERSEISPIYADNFYKRFLDGKI